MADFKKFILSLRYINKNKSVGLTFPKEMSKYLDLKNGKFKTKCYKKNNKIIIEIDKDDILSD